MLKALDAVTTQDVRYANMAGPSGVLSITLADHHAAIAEITISPGAPEDVTRVFGWSLNVMLYSWFDYELSSVAALQAFAALEMALRQRLKVKTSFRGLLEKAVSQEIIPPFLGNIKTDIAISTLRNDLAHGSANIFGPAMILDMLQRCAELINFLYPIANDPS
jgi:hypothetical protein